MAFLIGKIGEYGKDWVSLYWTEGGAEWVSYDHKTKKEYKPLSLYTSSDLMENHENVLIVIRDFLRDCPIQFEDHKKMELAILEARQKAEDFRKYLDSGGHYDY